MGHGKIDSQHVRKDGTRDSRLRTCQVPYDNHESLVNYWVKEREWEVKGQEVECSKYGRNIQEQE